MTVESVGPPVETLTLTREQAIKVTQFGKDPIDRGIKSGELPAIRVGKEGSKRPRYLIRRVDLEAWLERLAKGEISSGEASAHG